MFSLPRTNSFENCFFSIDSSFYESGLVDFAARAVRTRSYSDEEGGLAKLVLEEMKALGYADAFLDSTGNVAGRLGTGEKIVHFDSHLDTVQVNDAGEWDVPPFSGAVVNGYLWGRGSVDMKSGLCASVYGAALAEKAGFVRGKTVYVTGTVCEEYCDGESLRALYAELGLRPDCCVVCEPSDNVITLGHKGKAQVRVKTRGVSAHGSAPEKGKNAVYEMAEIIRRAESLNETLSAQGGGTVVLSDISCVSASLNAVPSECSIYLDRRLAAGETLERVKEEMDALVQGKDAFWEAGTLRRASWTGKELAYEPMHAPWSIPRDHELTRALRRAVEKERGTPPERYDFWDFSTNAVTPVSLGIPTVGFGPGEYKLAHMRNERCSVEKIKEACRVYARLIGEL